MERLPSQIKLNMQSTELRSMCFFLCVIIMFALVCFSLVDNGVGSAGACALAKLVSQSKTLVELW